MTDDWEQNFGVQTFIHSLLPHLLSLRGGHNAHTIPKTELGALSRMTMPNAMHS